MAKTYKVEFEYKGYDITAKGRVLNEDNVDQLQWTIKEDFPLELDQDTIDLINEEAVKFLLDKAYCPDLSFLKKV